MNRDIEEGYQYKIGQDVGIIDELTEDVEWYRLNVIEPDEDLSAIWLYLISDTEKLNDKIHPVYGRYAEIIETGSNRLVVI